MGSLWAFFTQTFTVSCVAALLLALKWLMEDKLSPRWQYGVWSVLALRMILPVPVSGYVLLPVPYWVEQWKTGIELKIDSVFSEIYAPAEIRHVLPAVSGLPQSVTDWLFVLYAVGVAVSALWYAAAYFRLRRLLRRGEPVDAEILAPVCRKYGLKSCRIVAVPGLDTAFVCGVIKPVLAIPADRVPDEKILLHELLHRKFQDPLQSIFWTAGRCLHWCNPFMRYVFNRIENDMESLCDQRVLELLEGEERREYGNILLDMASSRYARAPGTSSVSNGGENIARRIAAIVRFKKYPKGMALVSVCIVLMLIPSVFWQSAYAIAASEYHSTRYEWEMAMVPTRLRRCTTAAGAIDTYAKGLLLNDLVFVATASPLDRQQELIGQGEQYGCYQSGAEFADVYTGGGYQVYGLREKKDGSMLAWLAYTVLTEEAEKHTLLVPVSVSREGEHWVAQEAGERLTVTQPRDQLKFWEEDGPWVTTLYAQGEAGTVTVRRIAIHEVANTQDSGNMFGWISSFDTAMKPDAEFDSVCYMDNAVYVCSQPDAVRRKVGIRVEPVESPTAEVSLPQTQTGTGGGSSSYGDYHQNLRLQEDWNGILEAGGGYYSYGAQDASPKHYVAGIYWDEQLVETLLLTEVEP